MFLGLWYFFDKPQPQLIFALLPQFIGKGYATESALAIVRFAFQELGFTYLMAATDPPNLPSQQVLLRLGMQLVEKREEEGKVTWFYRMDKNQVKDTGFRHRQ